MATTYSTAVDSVTTALVTRTRGPQARCKSLATAYVDAAIRRAEAVTTATEPPPTAMKSAQLALLIATMDGFKDVPTPAEIAALFRITSSVARALLNEVLATSDTATSQLLKAVFSRASVVRQVNAQGKIPNGKVWRFATLSDLSLAKERLEFQAVEYRTESTTDGIYELMIVPTFQP